MNRNKRQFFRMRGLAQDPFLDALFACLISRRKRVYALWFSGFMKVSHVLVKVLLICFVLHHVT